MRILTIIITKNALGYIDRCLESLKASTVATDCIVVDNFSHDNTVDHIRRLHPWVEIVAMRRRSSFSKTGNIAFRKGLESDYDYFLVLHQNAYLEPDAIEKLVEESKRNFCGICAPLLLNMDKSDLEEGYSNYISYRSLKNIYNGGRSVPPFKVRFVNSAVWLIPRQVLEKVGGFDPQFNHYGEDLDWVNRLHYHKYNLKVVPHAHAVWDIRRKDRSHKAFLYSKQVYFQAELKNVNYRFDKALKMGIAAIYKDFFISVFNHRLRDTITYSKMILMINLKVPSALIRRMICKNIRKPFL